MTLIATASSSNNHTYSAGKRILFSCTWNEKRKKIRAEFTWKQKKTNFKTIKIRKSTQTFIFHAICDLELSQ